VIVKLKAERSKVKGVYMKFGYEDLDVWNKAVEFAVEVIELVESMSTGRKHYRLLEQVEASSASISMNIAEGKGRYSKKEFMQYLYIARGSLYETMTLLEIFRRKKWVSGEQYSRTETRGKEIVSMLKGLINSISNKKF
jgi:four helix bundle protein